MVGLMLFFPFHPRYGFERGKAQKIANRDAVPNAMHPDFLRVLIGQSCLHRDDFGIG